MPADKQPRSNHGKLAPVRPENYPLWHSWKGDKHVHPNASDGAGGPGNFGSHQPLTLSHTVTAADQARLHPSSPAPLGDEDELKSTGAKAKPAPVVTKDQAAVKILKEKTAYVEIDVEYQIKADSVDSTIDDPADTTLNDNWPDPVFTAPTAGKAGSMTWKGTIEIKTKYKTAKTKDPEDPKKEVPTASGYSCYGRGTKVNDRTAGNITLGFHESCHRADYAKDLNKDYLPVSPELNKDTTLQEFNDEKKRFLREVNEWRQAIIEDSDQNTDEVGHTKSQGGCFKHSPG